MLLSKILAGILAIFVVAMGLRAQKKNVGRTVRASETPSSSPETPRPTPSLLHAVVEREQAALEPYPYVQIESDGAARELHQSEREYLETPFELFDGARPYIKTSYDMKNGWGDPAGFLNRSALPSHISVQPAPAASEVKLVDKSAIRQGMTDFGFDVSDGANGTLVAKRRKADPDSKN